MLRRLKNLLTLSKYRVDEPVEITSSGMVRHPARLVYDAKPRKALAQIIEMKPYNPLNEFPDETPK